MSKSTLIAILALAILAFITAVGLIASKRGRARHGARGGPGDYGFVPGVTDGTAGHASCDSGSSADSGGGGDCGGSH